jgi:hypothetical protein
MTLTDLTVSYYFKTTNLNVGGSNPPGRTNKNKGLEIFLWPLVYLFLPYCYPLELFPMIIDEH